MAGLGQKCAQRILELTACSPLYPGAVVYAPNQTRAAHAALAGRCQIN